MTTRFVPHVHADSPRVSTDRVGVIFKDGQHALLHAVIVAGGNSRFLRAVPHVAGEYLVDLRKLAPALGDELPLTPANDRDYLVAQTLRFRFSTRAEFMAAVHLHASKGLAEV